MSLMTCVLLYAVLLSDAEFSQHILDPDKKAVENTNICWFEQHCVNQIILLTVLSNDTNYKASLHRCHYIQIWTHRNLAQTSETIYLKLWPFVRDNYIYSEIILSWFNGKQEFWTNLSLIVDVLPDRRDTEQNQ